jgi:hypothetical protein
MTKEPPPLFPSLRKWMLALLVCCLFALPTAWAQAQHATTTFVGDVDITIGNCSGERVHIFGTLEVRVQTTVTPTGAFITQTHSTPHLIGVGVTSGRTYVAVGPAQSVSTTTSEAGISHFVDHVMLVAPGSTLNTQVISNYHETINANGIVTVTFDSIMAACRG